MFVREKVTEFTLLILCIASVHHFSLENDSLFKELMKVSGKSYGDVSFLVDFVDPHDSICVYRILSFVKICREVYE